MSRPFEVGERVTRPRDIYALPGMSPLRHGVVMERYARAFNYGGVHGTDDELYAVRWDDSPHTIDRGYFRHGLEIEAPQ